MLKKGRQVAALVLAMSAVTEVGQTCRRSLAVDINEGRCVMRNMHLLNNIVEVGERASMARTTKLRSRRSGSSWSSVASSCVSSRCTSSCCSHSRAPSTSASKYSLCTPVSNTALLTDPVGHS